MLDEQPSVFPSVIRMSFETLQCETLCAGSLYVLMLPVLALLYLRAHRHQFKTKRKLILRFGLIFSGYASHRWYQVYFLSKIYFLDDFVTKNPHTGNTIN